MADSEAHVTRAHLMAYLDGELAGEVAERTELHLEGCASCRRTLEELEGDATLFGRAVPALDVPVPERDASSARHVATIRERERRSSGRRSRNDGPRRGAEEADREGAGRSGAGRSASAAIAVPRWTAPLKAAVLVLAAATAAAAVVPESPLREWIAGTVGELTGGSPPATTDAPSGARSDEPETVSIPVAGRAVVQIERAAPGLRVIVRETDTERLAVTARGASFETGVGSIGVSGARPPDLTVDLPGSATSARISAGGRLLLERERGELTLHVPADTIPAGLALTLGEGRTDG